MRTLKPWLPQVRYPEDLDFMSGPASKGLAVAQWRHAHKLMHRGKNAEAVEWLRTAADLKYGPALKALTMMLRDGWNAEATNWIEVHALHMLGVEVGESDCLVEAGIDFCLGRGCAVDRDAGLKLLERAIDAGDRKALYWLSFVEATGECPPPSRGIARDMLRMRAMQNSSACKLAESLMLIAGAWSSNGFNEEGLGQLVELAGVGDMRAKEFAGLLWYRDPTIAKLEHGRQFLADSAEAGSIRSALLFGLTLLWGEASQQSNILARYWLQKARKKYPNEVAFALAYDAVLKDRENSNEKADAAVRAMLKIRAAGSTLVGADLPRRWVSGELGNRLTQDLIDLMTEEYRYGNSVCAFELALIRGGFGRFDLKERGPDIWGALNPEVEVRGDEAMFWMQCSAEEGYSSGFYGMGRQLKSGDICEINMPAATVLLESAAALGHVNAAADLAMIYLEYPSPKGIIRNSEFAARVNRYCAENACAWAASNLAIQFEKGDGVKVDLEKSEYFRQLAVQLNKPDETEALDPVSDAGKAEAKVAGKAEAGFGALRKVERGKVLSFADREVTAAKDAGKVG